ncbi:MAG: prepilin-type N-terminal cleavage/methylation domain-containing protein [Lentisphaerota bacterium]
MHRITRNKFTLIEVLLVLVIAGILLGVSLAGLGRMFGRQGASGAVRTLSAQMALARSYAVVKNSYVALLLPDATDTDHDTNPAITVYSNFNKQNLSSYCYSKSRICLVTNFDSTTTPSTAKFAGWIDGNEWQNLPSGVCAQFDTVPPSSAPFQVTGVDGIAALNSTAIVFTTNGTVAGGNNVNISVFMGKYVTPGPNAGNLVFTNKSGKTSDWNITVNPFTGRASYEKQTN